MRKYLVLFFLLSACSSTDSVPPAETNKVADNDKGSQIICTREKQVGTHFARRVCRTRRQIEEEQREAAELLDRTTINQTNATE